MESFEAKLVEKIKDKVVVLFGEPYAGKTTLAKKLKEYFDKTVWFKIDKNYEKEEVEGEKCNVYEINSWKEAEEKLDEIILLAKNIVSERKVSMLLVIDSLSTLATDFLKDRINSPRKNNELAAFYDRILQKLSVLKDKGVTSLVITHEALKKFPDVIAPRMNVNALRHSDIVLRAYIKENGARAIKVWKERRQVENPKFFFEIE